MTTTQSGTTSVHAAINDYRYAILNLSPKSQKEYLSKLSAFDKWCEQESITLDQVKQVCIRRFVEHLRKQINVQTGTPISPITIAGYCRVLKAFLGWCSREDDYEDVVSSKVAARIEMPRVEQKIIDIFTSDHIRALFAACEQEYNDELKVRDKAILSVLVDTGIRASELVGLTLDCCFLEPNDAYLKVLGKGNKWREVALGRQAVNALRRYITRYRHSSKDEQHTFLNRYGAPMTISGLDQLIDRLGEWGHVKGVRCSPHTFRHSYAVSYLNACGDVYKLSRLMGHTSVKVTELYLRAVSNRQARNGVSVLDSMR